MDKCIDIPYEDALTITPEEIQGIYGCTEEEAREAMIYIGYFLQNYDPKDKEEYNKEYDDLMEKIREAGRKDTSI